MGVLVTRDPNELTRVSITAWEAVPTRTLETLGETLAELLPCSDTVVLSEEHVFHEESMLELATEFMQYIKDLVDDKLVPSLFQVSIIRHGSSHYEMFLLQHSQPIPEDVDVELSFESIMWWDEPRPEIEVEFRLWANT